MSASKDANLVQAYIELNKFCQSADYDRALKAAGKVLQIAPNEQKAFHCKVICLIHLHNFKEALIALNSPKNVALAANLHFEKAYTQYRLNCPRDALQTVDEAPELTPALKELRAQILYRLEQYQDCYNLYRDIVKNTTDDYEDERNANVAAVVANLTALNPKSDVPQLLEHTYELTYNAGCTLAAKGRHSECVQVLKRAETTCVDTVLEDGGTDEEAREEASIIRVQQAYCLQMLGKEKEAAVIYLSVLKDKPSDIALVAIASNNLVVINRETNVFDSRKRMKAATQEGLEHKLTTAQRAAIVYNQAILAIYSNQSEFCKQCCVKLSKEYGQQSRAALVEATKLSREGDVTTAVSLLVKHGGTLVLAAVQILLTRGDRKSAIKLLEESEFKYRAGVIGVLCTLFSAENEIERASDLFTDVYEHYKNDKSAISSLREVWRAAGVVHGAARRPSRQECAHNAFCADNAVIDTRSLARLVRGLAEADPARAKLLAKNLPRFSTKEGTIDIDALESSKWMMGAKVVKKTTQANQSPGTPSSELAEKKKSKKRKRKTKLPINVDLSRAPDPERWLPKYERSAYRKRRGIRRDVIKGSQGMTTAATDQYDMSKQQNQTAASAAAKSPRVEARSTEAGWQRKQQQKKKAGKGRKW